MRIATLLISLICTTSAFAEESFARLYHLTTDVRNIIVNAPGGNPNPEGKFALKTAEADQMLALSTLDNSFRENLEMVSASDRDPQFSKDCLKLNLKLSSNEIASIAGNFEKRPYRIEAVITGTDHVLIQEATNQFKENEYTSLMYKSYQEGNAKALWISSYYNLVNEYKFRNPGKNLDSMDLISKEKELRSFAESYSGMKLPDGLMFKEVGYHSLVDDSQNWKANLSLLKDKLSSKQKIDLVARLGGAFGDRYSYTRLDQGNDAHGTFVSTEELLKSVKTTTEGGVCRDIALAQTQMLQELGFKNNYVVSFKSFSGRHATVITTDPETGKVIKFNYNEISEAEKDSGKDALAQDSSLPDYGLSYKIYNTEGKPVTKVPSELGQIMKEATSGNIERNFEQKNYSLSRVLFSSPVGNGNLFYGKTSTGLQIYGAAVNTDVLSTSNMKVNVGAAVSKVQGEKTLVHMDQTNLFGRINAELSTPGLKLGSTQTKAFVGGDITVLASKTTETSNISNKSRTSDLETDVEADYRAGVKSTYTSADGKLSVDGKVYANFYPDWNHGARNDKIVMARDSIVVQSGISHKFNDGTRALLDTAVIMKNYGTSVVVKGAYEDDHKGARYIAGGSMPLTKDMPTFFPGGERRLFAGMEKKKGDFTFVIELERNLDNKAKSVHLKGEYKF